MATELDYTFRAMGSDVRLLIGDRLLTSAPPPLEAADRERAFVWDFSDRLSRFRQDSELSELNHNRSPVVDASRLLRAAVSAGLWAAQRSGGLVDPTLVRALERNGYDHSLDGVDACLARRGAGRGAASSRRATPSLGAVAPNRRG